MNASASKSADKTVVDRTRNYSATANTVRKLRGDITSTSADPIEFDLELTENFARNHLNAGLVMPLLTLIIAIIGYSFFGIVITALWYFSIALSYLLLTYQSRQFIKRLDDIGPLSNWHQKFLISHLLLSICWSIFAVASAKSGFEGSYTIIQFSTILVIQAVTAMLSYGLRQSVMIVCAPPTLIIASRFMFTNEPSMMMMGAILIGSLIFFFILAAQFKLSVLTVMKHKGENETLIAELETAQAISEEARRRAEEANLAKSRFLATMSHELRTPLNAILGFSEIMKNETLGPINNEHYLEYATDIHSSGDHLLKVINEILDLSRIEAGRQKLNESAVHLPFVVEEARNMTLLKAKNKGITISVKSETDLPNIWVDERAVRQITLNLLANAVKFTPSGGAIEVKVGWTSSGGQYLSIVDNGPGIPEDEIPIVLSSFGQGSIAIKSAEQGSGLGLPIVQALMHMHEGRFELKSKLRQGTTVTASFPRQRVLEVMPPVDLSRGRKRDKKQKQAHAIT